MNKNMYYSRNHSDVYEDIELGNPDRIIYIPMGNEQPQQHYVSYFNMKNSLCKYIYCMIALTLLIVIVLLIITLQEPC